MASIRYLALALVAVLSVFSIHSSANNLRFEHVITAENLAIAETNVIFQDSLGYMWFGGGDGLAKYDGHSFTLFQYDSRDHESISHNFVWDIIEDHKQRLWVATPGGLNLYDRAKNKFHRFQHDSNDPNSLISNDVYTLFEDSQNSLWVGTRDGLDRLNESNGRFEHYLSEETNPDTISNNSILKIFEDSNQRLWLGTKHGLNQMDRKSGLFVRYPHITNGRKNILDSNIRDIAQSDSEYLWVATDNGLFKFYFKDTSVTRYIHDPETPQSLSNNRIWKLLIDSEHTLWIATDQGGLNIYNRDTDDFTHHRHNPYNSTTIKADNVKSLFEDSNRNHWIGLFPSGVDYIKRSASVFSVYKHDPQNSKSLNNNSVNAIHIGANKSVWLGTEGGISLFDIEGREFNHFSHDPADTSSLSANAVLAIEQDKNGDTWIGTWSGGLNRYDEKTNSFTRYLPKKGENNAISSAYIWSLLSDSHGSLWIGSQEGALDRYDVDTDTFEHFGPNPGDPNSLSSRFIRTLFEDSQGAVWIGTLVGLNRYERSNNNFSRFVKDNENEFSIPHNYVLTIFEDSKNRLWVGTNGGLSLFDRTAERFTNYSTYDGLANDAVTGIQEDKQGYLWLSTLNGLSRFDPEKKTFHNYYHVDGIAGNVMNKSASLMTDMGRLFIGSTEGLTVFSPENIIKNSLPPPVKITDFKVFNRSVVPGGEGAVLTKSIDMTKSLTLDHTQNVFSFEFAALNYQNPQLNRYQYMMEGFENSWNESGYRHSATYTNLNSGKYSFRVKAANNDGVWNNEGVSLSIEILPPPWLTWWAKVIYVLILAFAISLFLRSQQRKIRFEQEQVSRLESINKLKDEFLANTSHELRTPLNGIIGLTEVLIDDSSGQISEVARMQLRTIAGSGRRLSSLINDILDFSKIKNHGLKLDMQTLDVEVVCTSVVRMLEPLAMQKNLLITHSIPEKFCFVNADIDRLEQILYNLLGNAIKFTEKGTITLSAREDNGFVYIDVADTGVGIEPTHVTQIFESFSQVQGDASREYEGTGLGLAVAKKLVELHGGKIHVRSALGSGSVFTFNLMLSQGTPVESIERRRFQRLNSVVDIDEGLEQIVAESPNTEEKHFHVLVVDDDTVNRKVLTAQLAIHDYKVSEVESGQAAIDLVASDSSIDLILLDVMMPKMTGYEAAKIIRQKHAAQDLPIIFITAKHLAADLAEAFSSGGNDFIVKPVSKNELLSRTATHLRLLDITRNLESLVAERTQTLSEAHKVLDTLDTVVRHINEQDSLAGLVDVMLQESLNLFGQISASAFWMKSGDDDGFRCVSSILDDLDRFQLSIKADDFDCYLADGAGSITDDLSFASKPFYDLFCHRSSEIGSLFTLSIVINETVQAIVVFISNEDMSKNLEGYQDTLLRFKSHAISAVSKAQNIESLQRQNEDLVRASLTDPLTNLNNRRFFMDHIGRDIDACNTLYSNFVGKSAFPKNADILFVLFDLDDFKAINDQYGHKAGDMVLIQFSNLLRSMVDDNDYVIRWGGEEFMLVIRACGKDRAAMLVERIRSTVGEHLFELNLGVSIRLSCSTGYSYYPFYQDSINDFSWEQVVDVADRCLGISKKSGKNTWLGLFGRTSGSNRLSYLDISQNPERCAKNRSLVVQSSITSKQNIRWKP
ncbi:MAG: two-component system sensor histidine kinase ChiS [Flavobacteriales bacterium]|jgi:two-component system sensor histidine kinase ChiS